MMRSRFLTMLMFLAISSAWAAETKEPRVIDFKGPPHSYLEWKPKDRFAEFLEKAQKGGVKLDIDFVFACEAETLIFQLGLR